MDSNEYNQALNTLNASMQGLATTVASYNIDEKNRDFAIEQAEKEKEWNLEMWNKVNAYNEEMWNKTNEYNSPTAQIQRLRDAGLNPLYYGLDGTSAKAYETGQPLAYQRADYATTFNPVQQGLEMFNQSRALAKDIELKNAQIDKIKEDTASVALDNEWKDRTMDARVEAEQLANNLTKAQIDKIGDERKNIQQELKKLIEETDNEVRRGILIEAQSNLAKMQEKEIAELLPYRKLLIEAQTEAQKASALASYAKAAIDRGLLEGGYVDKMLDSLDKDIELKGVNINSAEAQAAIAQFKAAIRTGNIYGIDENDWFLTKAGKKVLNSLFQDFAILADTITSPISNILK